MVYYAGQKALIGKDLERLNSIFQSFLTELEKIYYTKKKLESKYIADKYFFPLGLNNERVME